MATEYLNNWLLFTVAFTLLLVVSFIMQQQSKHFYTQDVIVKKFSIMELELPATSKELYNIITGLFRLPADKSRRSLNALRGQLWIDFLFMPLAYGCIFLLCWRVANKMHTAAGYIVFMAFAVGQIIAWICDIFENIFLLSQLKPNVKEMSERRHQWYLRMEAVKWGLSVIAAVCSISAVCYFWCTGEYTVSSLRYFTVVLAEIFIILAILFFTQKKKTAPLQ